MNKFKTILWDFDGVILDSMKIKGDGFVELFKNYDGKKVKLFEEYHYANGGISRFEKIRYFFNNILEENISEEAVQKFADLFANIIEKKIYDKSNLIEETLKFIIDNYKNYNFHIVSGAEHNELNLLCKNFMLDNYFISINGSPIKKEVLIKNILEMYGYEKHETILIGDAINDYDAAINNGIKFYGFNNIALKSYENYIDSFNDIEI